MVDRRSRHRFESELRVTLTTTEFISNVKTDAYMTDCSQVGARIISPIYFDPGQAIQIIVDILGGPLEIPAKVIECREDAQQKYRFEKTNVLHIQFDHLTEQELNTLIVAGKK